MTKVVIRRRFAESGPLPTLMAELVAISDAAKPAKPLEKQT